MARYAVDRLEESCAVVEVEENGVCRMENIPLAQLPAGVKEGDILCRDGATGMWRVDREATDDARRELFRLQQSLFE